MNRSSWWQIFPAASVVVCAPAHATTYLTIEQAQAAIFPGAKLVAAPVELTEAQRRAVERRSGVGVRDASLRAWRVAGGGWFLVDEVLGKHELITYAMGISAEGRVAGIEIMDYRESYGHEVRNPAWRAQFKGKTAADPLRLDGDIRNISGATLSSKHITDGVRRLLASYEIALK